MAFCFICTCCSLFACKLPRYGYVPPTLNTTVYSHAGEGQLGVQFGSAGFAAHGGIAITKNINVNAWAATFPADSTNYGSKESEISIGFQTNPNSNNGVTSFYLGLGNGSNKKERTGLSGHFNRSFFQIQRTAFDKPLGGASYDAFLGLRINYLSYNGSKGPSPLSDYLFYYEPYFGASIGGKNVRLEILQGLAIKNSGEWGHGLQIFPYFGNIGLLVKLRKK